MSEREFGKDGFGGSPVVGSSKALDMIRFPLPVFVSNVRRLGHPVRLAKNGHRKRVKSAPQGRVK